MLYLKTDWHPGGLYTLEPIYGYFRAGLDKQMSMNRSVSIIPGLGYWFYLSNNELRAVREINLSVVFKREIFINLIYDNMDVKNRNDIQHSVQISIGTIIKKDEPYN